MLARRRPRPLPAVLVVAVLAALLATAAPAPASPSRALAAPHEQPAILSPPTACDPTWSTASRPAGTCPTCVSSCGAGSRAATASPRASRPTPGRLVLADHRGLAGQARLHQQHLPPDRHRLLPGHQLFVPRRPPGRLDRLGRRARRPQGRPA